MFITRTLGAERYLARNISWAINRDRSIANRKNSWDRKGLNACASVAWGDALTSQVCLFRWFVLQRLGSVCVQRASVKFPVYRVSSMRTRVSLLCVRSPVLIHSRAHTLLRRGVRETAGSDGPETLRIRSRTRRLVRVFVEESMVLESFENIESKATIFNVNESKDFFFGKILSSSNREVWYSTRSEKETMEFTKVVEATIFRRIIFFAISNDNREVYVVGVQLVGA